LFGDRRKNPDAPVTNLKNGFADLTLLVAHFDPMQPLDFDLSHLVGNGMIALARQAVDTGPEKEMSTGILSDAEQLVDVALPVSDMGNLLRFGEQVVDCFTFSSHR
jgi:hypothetical protein